MLMLIFFLNILNIFRGFDLKNFIQKYLIANMITEKKFQQKIFYRKKKLITKKKIIFFANNFF